MMAPKARLAHARPVIDRYSGRSRLRPVADRLAALDYAVFLPDIYYRSGGYAPFEVATVFSDPAELERLTSLAASVSPEMIVRDAGAFLGFLAGRLRYLGPVWGPPGTA